MNKLKSLPSAFIFVIYYMLVQLSPLRAQSYMQYENKVRKHTLDNGIRVLVLERHEVPVVAFITWADVGAVNEVKGITGISHLFEHMAFKGTRTVGTKDFQAELVAMAKEDETFLTWRQEYSKGDLADANRLAELWKLHRQAVEEAKQYVLPNEFARIIETAGGVGMNAYTGYDQTVYFLSLPSNKVELWMSLESERFLQPILREFYTEKEVVMEERRRSRENQPIGKLLEEFLAAAYKAHPYGEPSIGHMSDLQAMSREDAMRYFDENYGPQNLILGIVGDVDAQQVLKLVEIYWGRLPQGKPRRPLFTKEPPQLGQKRIEVEDPMQPLILIGYHRPNSLHKDSAVLDAITDILGQGRSSRLYKSIVKEKKIAVTVNAISGLTEKYPGLYLFVAVPSQGHSTDECETAIYEEIEKLKREPLSAKELAAVKTRAKADFLRRLDSNQGIAMQLCRAEALFGNYREMFHEVEKIEAIAAEDVQRVAKEIFTKRNRTVAVIVPPAETAQ